MRFTAFAPVLQKDQPRVEPVDDEGDEEVNEEEMEGDRVRHKWPPGSSFVLLRYTLSIDHTDSFYFNIDTPVILILFYFNIGNPVNLYSEMFRSYMDIS